MPTPGAGRHIQLVAFEVGAEEFALDTGPVDRIGPLTDLDRSGAEENAAGHARCGEQDVPVFDLRACLGMPAASAPQAGRIIFVTDGARTIGLAVDRVCEILRVSTDMLTHGGSPAPWATGSLQLDDRTLVVLDAGRLLNELPSLPAPRRAA